MTVDWGLLEQEMAGHEWSDPALERAARGEHVTRGDLRPTWRQIAGRVLLLLVLVAVGVLLGLAI